MERGISLAPQLGKIKCFLRHLYLSSAEEWLLVTEQGVYTGVCVARRGKGPNSGGF